VRPVHVQVTARRKKEKTMPRFIANLHLENLFTGHDNTGLSSQTVLASLAFPLSIVSGLLLLDAALSASFTSGAIGGLGLIAAQAIKTRA
jgi:hypothetical protein